MNPDSTLAPTNVSRLSLPSSPLLESAWSSRSADELREIIEHGPRDDSFEAAARELERRARNLGYEAEASSRAEEHEWRLFRRFLFIGLALMAIVGLLLGLFVI